MKEYLNFMSLMKEGYQKSVSPVCEKYGLTFAEFDILMFLANNPEFDTAADIAAWRHIVKSQISISLRNLEERGYLSRCYKNNNRKIQHLMVCTRAEALVREGQATQWRFYEVFLRGFSPEQREQMKRNVHLLSENLECYVRGE